MSFELWFAKYLHQEVKEVELLLKDKTATKFLIAWSIFESKCFGGFVRIDTLPDFAKTLSENSDFDFEVVKAAAAHFHHRYQDSQRYTNLMHKQKSKELKNILSKEFEVLCNYEIALLLLLVIFRFRNNIFHGNKGVHSWLSYGEQINLCINTMQSFIPMNSKPE